MRKIIIILSACITVLLAGYVGYRSYLVWKQSHGIAMAKEYVQKSDLRSAYLSLQEVLRANSRNMEATRLMASLMEAERQPGALVWRERVLELNPQSFQDRVALAQLALVDKDYSLATNTLEAAAEADKNTVVYQNLAGTVALMGGRPNDAEACFREAIRLDPGNAYPALNLAVVQLHGTNSLDMAEARIALQKVILSATNASLCGQARRELIIDAMRFHDATTALNISRDLSQQPNSDFADKMMRLEVLLKTQNTEFTPVLSQYQTESMTNPIKISDLAKWESHNLSPGKAFNWLTQLPAQTRTNLTVEILAAELQVEMQDWRGLQAVIQNQNWNDPSHPWNDFDFMRHAYLARSLRGEGYAEGAAAEWVVATKAATNQRYLNSQKAAMKVLFELAVAWGWDKEAEQVLWTVVNQYPEERWASSVLRTALINWHRTRSLLQLFSIIYKRDPGNVDTENDLAATALLLGAQEYKPHDLAADAYRKAPSNSAYASTYAFSLYLQGRNGEALKVMQQLSSKDLEDPSIAAYYGLILKANGHNTEAKASLARGSKGHFLPEEEALFEQARAGL